MAKNSGMDSIKNSGFSTSQINNLKSNASNVFKNAFKPVDINMKKSTKKSTKKMSPDMIAKRKKKMVSNAASKVMGGLYSK